MLRRAPDAQTIILSVYHDRWTARMSIDIRIRGYVVKTDPPPRLVDAVRRVAEGGMWLSDEVLRDLAGEETGPVRLAPRE